MSNPQDQSKNERPMLNRFFSVMGIKADSIDRGPSENGNAKPDFVVCIDGNRVGIELTMYYREQESNESRPRQAKENAWLKLKKAIAKAKQCYSELNEVHGAIKFKDLVLPPSKEYGQFADELVDFTMNRRGELSFDHKCYKTFDEKYPLLNKYVEYLELKQFGCYLLSWDWKHEPGHVGLQKKELLGIIQAKIGKHVQSQVDEHWLLITSGIELSQQMGYLLVGKINKYESVCNLLNGGPFDKVYIYDDVRSRVVFWTLNQGWVAHTQKIA